jgi:lauroyl/myristoyl acyltransferase
VDLAKSLFHVTSRGAERVLPPIALWFLLWPLNEALAIVSARRNRERVPATRLPMPANSRIPSLFQRWRHFRRQQSHWWLLGWIDRLSSPKWQRRLTVRDLDKLTTVLAGRPVIICSLHTTSVLTLAAWLRSLGLPTAHVPVDVTWFSNPARLRKAALAAKMGQAFVLRPDQPREMFRFLKPGNILLLTADFDRGRVTNVPWRDASIEVGTGLFRMARSTGSAVVPVSIFETGRWSYEVTVFDPVPQGVIDGGDTDAAARYVVDRLVPLVAERPDQAMGVLVNVVKPVSAGHSKPGPL